MIGLNTGYLALRAAQQALDIIGNNVANVATDGYRRQAPSLASAPSLRLNGFTFGTGVTLADIRRNHDVLLDTRLRSQLSEQSQLQAGLDLAEEAEFILGEPSDTGLAARLGAFQDALSALTASPSDPALQADIVESGGTLARQFQRLARDLDRLDGNRLGRLENTVEEINSMGETLQDLNRDIANARSSGGVPADLIDRRDILLRDLSELVDLDVRIAEDQTAEVQVGNVLLVGRGEASRLAVFRNEAGQERLRVAGRDGEGFVPTGGEALGLMATGREPVDRLRAKIDELARGLIDAVNRVHGTGVGSSGSFTRLTSSYQVTDPGAPLVSGGLIGNLEPGAFTVSVTSEGTGEKTRTQIRFDPTRQSLSDLANQLDALDNISADVNADNGLTISSDSGFTFDFTAESGIPRDTTGVVGALGLNAFFTGTDARSIAVSAELQADPGRVAASATGDTGGNDNLTDLIAALDSGSELLGGLDLQDFYRREVTEIGFQVSQLQALGDSQSTLVSALEARQESLTGVSLEEELIELERYQTSFEAASRYLQVINQTTDQILSLGL
ncbi:MAG: flagellar hook-associated protein FlgK [Planctomycetota bacterium]